MLPFLPDEDTLIKARSFFCKYILFNNNLRHTQAGITFINLTSYIYLFTLSLSILTGMPLASY